MQRGDKTTYPDYLAQSEKDLKQAYGVISPRKVNLTEMCIRDRKYYVWIQKMNKNDEKHPESYNPYS